MDLRRSDLDGLTRLAGIWKTTPGAEFEAMLTGMDLTSWQDVIQYLRSLGMRENPQIVKMNICLSNDIRLTLEGAGVIQAYCRENRIGDKPFVAMLKESIANAEPVTLGSYGVKAKLKREIPLAADDARVVEALQRWDSLGKHFRNIQRFEFVAPGGVPIRFDVSIVRENAGRPARTFQESRVTGSPPRYEVEVELTASRETTEADRAVAHIVRGISWLLQGRQRSFALVSNQAAEYVRDSIGRIFGSGAGGAAAAGGRGNSNRNRNRAGPAPAFRFPGPQPATLERRHIVADAEPGAPNLRTMAGGYNVTDKADGLRCLLFVSDNGKIFLVDGGGRVYATGKQVEPSNAGLVLDGEWIRRDRRSAVVSHYYAFDIMAAAGGDAGVAGLPFSIAGEMMGTAATANTRQAVMAAAVGVLGRAVQTVRGVPANQNIQFAMKTFRVAGPGEAIFRDCATAVLADAKSAPYNTDGLIFTPNSAPLPLGRGTWYEQLKWKPAHENTIDFLVIVDRERGKDGSPTAVDAIGTKYREDSGQTVRYKTLRLFVGSNRDVAFADPRRTVLGGEALPASLEEGEWREVEFRPTAPRDPMAAICYVAVGEGIGDPAAAAPAAIALDTDTDLIRCTRSGDIIQSDMIVEMAYHPERAPGWRWEPTRVRHDKTERWLAQQASAAGSRKGGTMNADWVANSIWTTLHNPVTEEAVQTGIVQQCMAPVALAAGGGGGRRAPSRDLMKAQCLVNFHNDFIKRSLLLRRTLAPGSTICDLAMGHGDDITKWIAAPVSYALGCDVNADNLNNPNDGAYRRLLDKMVALGGRERVPPMVFAHADAARRLSTGEAGIGPEDQGLLRTEFGAGGRAAGGFDVVSCMFAIQYMFRDSDTLAGFLTNLADTVKVGGYFVGCGMDGDAVARLLAGADGNTVVGRDGRSDVWAITRRYDSAIGSSVPPSAAGLGRSVDVDFISMGETRTEYLMSWPYLQARLAEVGLEPLTADELAALGLPATSQMFSESWSLAEAAGETYSMSDALRRFSFLNRWWVLKRRADLRPAPPVAAVAGPGALTEMRPAEEEGGAAPPPPPAAGGLAAIAEAEEAEEAAAAHDVIEMAEAAPFRINPANKEADGRLGAGLADWPRYMSMGTLVETADLADPAIKYPSLEAALAAAKYQRATEKPELGAQLFRVEGAIHQKFERDREKLRSTGAPASAIEDTVDNQVALTRVSSGKAKIKAYKATWNQEAWDAQKLDIYRAYLTQRYATDERFRAMVNAIKALGGTIELVNGTDYNELGVGIRVDGSSAGGDNKVGKIIAELGA